jgi:hypothetical protein
VGGDRVGIVGILSEKNVLYGSGLRNGGAFLHWNAQSSSAVPLSTIPLFNVLYLA